MELNNLSTPQQLELIYFRCIFIFIYTDTSCIILHLALHFESELNELKKKLWIIIFADLLPFKTATSYLLRGGY